MHDVPVAAPGDERGDAERHHLAADTVDQARACDVPVADAIGADARANPVGLLLRHDDSHQRGVPGGLAPDQVVGGDDVSLEFRHETALPVGGRIGDGFDLLVGEQREEGRHGEVRPAGHYPGPQVGHLGREHRAAGWRQRAGLMLAGHGRRHADDRRPRRRRRRRARAGRRRPTARSRPDRMGGRSLRLAATGGS